MIRLEGMPVSPGYAKGMAVVCDCDVAAGHQAYLIAKDGAVRVLRSHSVPIGVEDTMTPCPATRSALKAGDILVVPTDGTEEAMSVDGRQFGRGRILDVVRNNRDRPAVEIVEA